MIKQTLLLVICLFCFCWSQTLPPSTGPKQNTVIPPGYVNVGTCDTADTVGPGYGGSWTFGNIPLPPLTGDSSFIDCVETEGFNAIVSGVNPGIEYLFRFASGSFDSTFGSVEGCMAFVDVFIDSVNVLTYTPPCESWGEFQFTFTPSSSSPTINFVMPPNPVSSSQFTTAVFSFNPTESVVAGGFSVNTIEGDNIVNASEESDVIVSGFDADPGSTMDITLTDASGTTITINDIPVNSDGTFSTPDTDISSLDDGSITVVVTETTGGGDTSAPVTVDILKDTAAPNLPTITTPIEGDNIVSFSEEGDVVISGSGEPDGTIDLILTDESGNTITINNIAINSSGSWSTADTDISALEDGTITVTATQTDMAGNTSSPVNASFTKNSVVRVLISEWSDPNQDNSVVVNGFMYIPFTVTWTYDPLFDGSNVRVYIEEQGTSTQLDIESSYPFNSLSTVYPGFHGVLPSLVYEVHIDVLGTNADSGLYDPVQVYLLTGNEGY